MCLYLDSCVPFVPEPHDTTLKQCCLNIFRKFEQWPQAMQMALKLNDLQLIQVRVGSLDLQCVTVSVYVPYVCVLW